MNFIEEKGDFVDKKLGITQDYDRSSYDSASAKKAYKEKVFGDSAAITDSTTGEILHKSQTAAQKKYHMKNADGENVSKKWAKHSAETDHINSLKSVHDKVKHNPFLSDDDVQEIANCDENLRILPKSLNASKGEKSDFEVIIDTDNGLSLKGRVHLAEEKIKSDVALTGKFTARTAENIGILTVDSAKKSVEDNAMKFVRYGVDHIVDVATGEESLEDAVVDVGAFTIETVGKDVIKNVADAALVNNALYQSLKNSGALGQLIQVGTIVAESASRLIDGEITADEFMFEIGDKGATMVAQMIGSEVGAVVGEIIGISAGGILGAGAGEIIGRAIGTMIATVACNVIIAVRTNIINNLKSLDDYKLKEKAIRKLETEAIAEMEYQRQKFRNIVENEYQKWDKNIESGFDMIIVSACKEVYDLQGIINGLDKILSVFGKSVMFKNLDEYELQLDMPLKLNF